MDIGAWLSLVERCVRDAEVAGSNPVAPTLRTLDFQGFFLLCKKVAWLNKTKLDIFVMPLL